MNRALRGESDRPGNLPGRDYGLGADAGQNAPMLFALPDVLLTGPAVDGVRMGMGPHRSHRSLAQLSNVVWPTPQLYERLWRVRSASLLSGGAITLADELRELRSTMPTTGIVVDIGCSEGLYSRTVAAEGTTVIAVDHSMAFLRRVVARSGPLPVVAVQALAQHLPIADASLDGVMIGGSLNEIGDMAAAAAEMARVTKPGAPLFSMSLVTAASTRRRVVQRLLRVTGVVFPTVARTIDLYSRAGFRIEGVAQDGIVLRLRGIRLTS